MSTQVPIPWNEEMSPPMRGGGAGASADGGVGDRPSPGTVRAIVASTAPATAIAAGRQTDRHRDDEDDRRDGSLCGRRWEVRTATRLPAEADVADRPPQRDAVRGVSAGA